MGISMRFDRNGHRTTLTDREPRCNKGIGGHDHLVAGPDAVSSQQEVDRLQPVAYANTVLDLTVICELGLKCFQFGARASRDIVQT